MTNGTVASQSSALTDLKLLVEHQSIPNAPPVYERSGATVGLAFLDAALRLNHVSRISERLQLFDRAHVTRWFSVDVSLGLLTPTQLESAIRYNVLRHGPPTSAAHDDPVSRLTAATYPATTAWVPIARLSKKEVAPVEVFDSSHEALPRLTQNETTDLLNAGMYRLFRLILESRPDASETTSVLYAFLRGSNRARWLIEESIARYLNNGRQPATLMRSTQIQGNDSLSTRQVSDAAIRAQALDILDEYFGDPTNPYCELLRIAAAEYIVVVGLRTDRPEQTVSYQGPTLPARQASVVSNPVRRLVRGLLPTNREFVMTYKTPLSRAISSYHLTVEVQEEIKVRRFLLSTSNDQSFVDAICADLEEIACLLPTSRASAEKLVEYEFQRSLSRLQVIVDRRLEELDRYVAYERTHGSRGQIPIHVSLSVLRDEQDAVERMGCSESFDTVVALVRSFADGRLRHMARSPFATAPVAQRLAEVLRRLELGDDVTLDNDPRENGAHAYWRRPLRLGSSRELEPNAARAVIVLADEPPALIGSVFRMIISLLLTVYGIGLLLFTDWAWVWRWNDPQQALQADAMIAVLLLLPGLMLSRLDLPSTNSVLGQLRLLPRRLAYGAVGATTAMAVATAATEVGGYIHHVFVAGLIVLVMLAALSAVDLAIGMVKSRDGRLDLLDAPVWLHEAASSARLRSPRRIDAEFAAVPSRGDR